LHLARLLGIAILGSVQIVRAQSDDAPTLSSIAWAATAHWGYPSHWMEQWCDQLTITPEFVAANETFAAIIAGQMIAFYALLETTETLRLDHLWVLPERIGQGDWPATVHPRDRERSVARSP
jgi:hypothetical protein